MKKTALVLFFALVAGLAHGQDLNKYKALFTLNFVRYISWPDTKKQGDFVIGVVKNKALADQIRDKSAGKKIGYQQVVVKDFKNAEEISECHILYVGEYGNYNRNAAEIGAKVKGMNTLIISEDAGAVDAGSMINFVVRDNKLKFEIKETNAKTAGLVFNSGLMGLSNAIVL